MELLTDNPDIKSVYISGQITGMPNGNKEAFQEAGERVQALGLKVVSPTELDEAQNLLTEQLAQVSSGSDEWAELLTSDILHVTAVDAVVVLPGWARSKGAKLEVYLAVALNKPIYNSETFELIPKEELPQPEKAGTLLEEAQLRTDIVQMEQYGHPYEAFTRDAQIVSALLGKEITPEEIPLIMAGLKLSRYAHNPSRGRSALIDVAGYVETIEQLAERLGGWSKLAGGNKESS